MHSQSPIADSEISARADGSFPRYLRRVVTDLQSLGVRVAGTLQGRSGGAGPADGRAVLFEGIPKNVPIAAAYTAESPYSLILRDGEFLLTVGGEELFAVEVVPEPEFYSLADENGVGYRKIALLHGTDCLACTVIQRCRFWRTGGRCRFCGVEITARNGTTIETKSPEQLAEVARAALASSAISHVVLTSGTAFVDGEELDRLAECARSVVESTGLPVHVQFMPPGDLGRMEKLKESGVATVGIHAESFDPDVLARMAPAKSELGMQRYERAWKKAVELFGPNQVSSFVIVGLGETDESVIRGGELLADLGVFPYVVPLRPVPGSLMAGKRPPAPERMENIYEAVAEILRRKGLSSGECKAGCVRCGACSALSLYEGAPSRVACHVVRSPGEIRDALDIRRRIFVEEQRLFEDSDVDDHDAASTYLVAETGGGIVGTVRVFRSNQDDGHWVGGRLAVLREYRSSQVGEMLVREAVRYVRGKGCTRFTAHIQEQNIRFFGKLGWTPVGEPVWICGKRHQLMAADLT